MRYDIIIIGGDDADARLGERLQKAGKRCCLICEGGLREGPLARKCFTDAGGTLLVGDSVAKFEWSEDGSLASLRTEKLEDTPLSADNFILMRGRFVTGGLCSDMNHIREPLFGADVEYEPERDKWTVEDFFAPQPFESFGVLCDGEGHVLKGGKPITNLYACGSILAGGVDNTETICRKLL